MKVRHVARITVSNVDKKSAEGEQPVRLCNYIDVYNHARITSALDFMLATASREQMRDFNLRLGDVVITKDSETPEDIGVPAFVADEVSDLVCGYHLAILRPDAAQLDGRYLYWAIKSATTQAQFTAAASGITRFGLRRESIGSAELPVPSLPDQRAIADYLDLESTRLDRLVEKRKTVVSREAERFHSIIYSATSGRHVSGQRRMSGLGWVDSVPGHWQVRKVVWDYEIQLGKMLNPEAAGGPDLRPYLANRDVQWDRLLVDDLRQMSFDTEERQRLALKPGDLLVCEGGEVGRAAIWSGDLPECYYQKAIHRLRPRGTANPRFLMYCLWAAASRGVFSAEGNQSTVVHLTAEQLAAHRFPFPDPAEQAAIVSALDRDSERLRAITALMNEQIDLLLERRRAMITTAVNGQLPIPGVAA